MSKKMKQSLGEALDGLKNSTLLLYAVLFVVSTLLCGTLVRFVMENLNASIAGESWRFRLGLFAEGETWLIGLVINIVFFAVFALNGGFRGVGGRGLLGGKGEGDRIEGSLENSRFLTDKERDKYFPTFTYETLKDAKNDGVPARAVLDKNGKLVGNWKPGVHALVIGATGSGKTTTFINPMIQCIAATNCGSSMIMTDPKGELFDLHSGF